MEAKSKPVDVLSLADLSLDGASLAIDDQKVTDIFDAPGRESGVMITDVDSAADKIVEFLESAGVL
jgi:electron transfer flavoprotein alpha/beta subunit